MIALRLICRAVLYLMHRQIFLDTFESGKEGTNHFIYSMSKCTKTGTMYLKSARSESLLGIFWEKGTQSPISTQASTDGQFYYLVLTELIV